MVKMKCDLSLSQASAQAVGGVLFSLQTLQVSLQTLFSMTYVLQEIRGFCARLHGLEEKEAARSKMVKNAIVKTFWLTEY